LSLDGWVPMSLLHPVHQPPTGLGTSPNRCTSPTLRPQSLRLGPSAFWQPYCWKARDGGAGCVL